MYQLLLQKNIYLFNRNYLQKCCIYGYCSTLHLKSFSTDSSHAKPEWTNYAAAKHGTFSQKMPRLKNPYFEDISLQKYLITRLPKEVHAKISKDLIRFGDRIIDEIDDIGWKCELEPPTLQTYNAWGQNISELSTCSAWKQQHSISASEGLIAIAYERKLDYWSRIHQICKLYMYSPSSGLYSCPLAMTDGAARVIEINGLKNQLLSKAFENLTSWDPEKFWVSGQWMTEKRGGSDVANSTETIAIKVEDFYRLYGYKWFTSAADSHMALTLASVQDNDTPLKVSGLTMFVVETRKHDGSLNNMQIVRLKNKLGTRQLPTGELLLDGTIAHKMSEEGRGIASISGMLNVTRLHNSISSVACMRRILSLARDYSYHRQAFGQTLVNFPLHMRVLAKMEVETRGCLMLLLQVGTLFGKAEMNTATEDEVLLLRLLLPIMKLYTAKQAVALASEGLEAFGGQGYMEDTRLPQILRDAQVLPIWEGTTNIMSLDVLRSLMKSNFQSLLSLEKHIKWCLESAENKDDLKNSALIVNKSLQKTIQFINNFPNLLTIAAREVSYSLAKCYIGALLIEHAVLLKTETDVFAARQWCETQNLYIVDKPENYEKYSKSDFDIVMNGYDET